jgi:hypothetical protein
MLMIDLGREKEPPGVFLVTWSPFRKASLTSATGGRGDLRSLPVIAQ